LLKSKKVQAEYQKLIDNFGSELHVLLDLDLKMTVGTVNPLIIEGIKRVRSGQLIINPGFDGQYGVISIFNEKENKKIKE
jgi:PHP family Zn ribbon phosphoesterase